MGRIADKQKILIVDDSEVNRSILAAIFKDEYEIIEAGNGNEGLAVLQQYGVEISLILLDMVMPELDGFGMLSEMRKSGWIEEIPVIAISGDGGAAEVKRAFDLGATDFFTRQVDLQIVHQQVVNIIQLCTTQKKLVSLVTEQMYEKEHQSKLMVDILGHIVEFRNGESGMHVHHVQTLTETLLLALAQKTDKYQLSQSGISTIATASALHDVGKITIPEEILNKPGRFTPEEFEIMKTHSAAGAEMLRTLSPYQDEPLIKTAYQICRWHHERWDGRGYPDGLKGDEIPICAQIVAMADVYDALTSPRVYKAAYTHEQAIKMILNGECGAFNPLVLECLQDCADQISEGLGGDDALQQSRWQMQNAAKELMGVHMSGTSLPGAPWSYWSADR